MLQFVEKISNVGVFKDCNGGAHPFERVSLIYAGNGHGKSTLSAVLDAAGTDDSKALKARQSLGSHGSTLVKLGLLDGSSRIHANGAWTGSPLRSWVFNSEFVDRNVHTGGSVQPAHRAGLLAFAIGKEAVTQEEALGDAQEKQKTAKLLLAQNGERLLAFARAIDPQATLETFDRIIVPSDAVEQAAAATAKLLAARNAGALLAREVPAKLPTVSMLSAEFFETITSTLDETHARARELVAAHVESLAHSNMDYSKWLADGLGISPEAHCPFCGQSTAGIELVDLYPRYFNKAYEELRFALESYETKLNSASRATILAKIESAHALASSAMRFWQSHVSLPDLPSVNDLGPRLEAFGEQVDVLVQAKKERLESSVGSSDDRALLESLEASILESVRIVNEAIQSAIEVVEAFKASIAPANLPQLASAQVSTSLTVMKGTPDVLALIGERAILKQGVVEADRNAKKAREALKVSMERTLGRFETEINAHLGKLGASFSIEKISASFAGGGGGRSSYGLNLRGHSIDLSKGEPPFKLALSEGDQRTLAFAFFCVTVLAQADLRNQIVVVDDPVTSLDRSRRRHTTDVLNRMSLAGAQVVVLAHDATYLREVRAKIAKTPKDTHDVPRTITEFQLSLDAQGNSGFSAIDLDVECESEYSRNYRRIRSYLEGVPFEGGLVLHKEVGESIRPLIESHLHRRFPGRIPSNKRTLGSVIGCIAGAGPADVLSHAKPLVPELRDLNDFGTRYHHDTSSDVPEPLPDAHEVRAFAARAFDIVHGATFTP